MEARHSAYEPGRPIEHLYFPLTGVISLVSVTQDGRSIEIATVGNEGVVGLPLFLGSHTAPGKAYAQVPGESLRVKSAIFQREVRNSGQLTRILHVYTHALLVQISQGMVCNRIHSVTERCARWLLMTHDRVRMNSFMLTQESLGYMLGIRRTGASEVATALRKRGLIDYSRGSIQVRNRRGLESLSCECYRVVKQEFDRLFGK
jgi:CRP-like cAMP-binding protein